MNRNITNKKTIGHNMNKEYFLSIYRNLKELLGDEYEFWKIGEDLLPEDEELIDLFDKTIPCDYNMRTLFRVIRNSSMVISQHSGIHLLALLFGIPVMETYIDKNVHQSFSKNVWVDGWGGDDSTLFLNTYEDKIWGGHFTSNNPPPSKLYLKEFLTRNELI